MRTVYFGTTDFAATVLDRLVRSGHRPVLVVSRPDRRRGRGRRTHPPPVARRARELDIELIQPEQLNAAETVARIAAAAADALCVCAYGAIIGDELLGAHDGYNVHPSLLPRWRGAAPVERAIQAGDGQTGVSIMRPVAELDAGPVHLSRDEPIHAADDYGSLASRLAELGGKLLVEALDTRPEPQPQSAEGVTYAEKVEGHERRLDPARPAVALERTVRALHPHIGTWVHDGSGDRLGVRRSRVVEGVVVAEGVLAAGGETLLMGTRSGALELLEVQPPGKRAMPASDYLRGRGPGRSPQ
ncbi:MAG: methionyl-tRNA formyltransferase [Thermoleophilaceae bacterium]|nr:methionyl-tRNA formyltransferase [Thermoleophilaceae bacterium]